MPQLEVDILVLESFLKDKKYSRVKRISISLGKEAKHRLICILNCSINVHKFKRTSSRIIREFNKNIVGGVVVESVRGYWSYYGGLLERHYSCEICSSDLSKIKLNKSYRNIVKSELNRRILKEYVKNPSKPVSEMELRKRFYYGKCKK